MDKGGYTYILTDRPFGVLYTGVTADMAERLTAHREGRGSKFARRWRCNRLVLIEPHATIEEAIAREKAEELEPGKEAAVDRRDQSQLGRFG